MDEKRPYLYVEERSEGARGHVCPEDNPGPGSGSNDRSQIDSGADIDRRCRVALYSRTGVMTIYVELLRVPKGNKLFCSLASIRDESLLVHPGPFP